MTEMDEPTRMLVFDGTLSQSQAQAIKDIYQMVFGLPLEVRRVIAEDLIRTYAHPDGGKSG